MDSEDLKDVPQEPVAEPESLPDEWEALFSEYDATQPQPEQSPQQEERAELSPETRTQLVDRLEQSERIKEWALEADEVLKGQMLERRREAEVRDIANVMQRAQEEFAEGLRYAPPGYLETFLNTEYMTNPQLQAAWDNRGQDARAAEKAVDRMFKKLHTSLSRIPDRTATEDREAVTQAMRSASNKAPVGRAPNYTNMDDKEFRESVNRDYGFDPGV